VHGEARVPPIDEAGRGSLWGPLYAGAVVWPDESDWTPEIRASSEKIKDSKKLSEKKRNILIHDIKKYALSYSIGIVTQVEIDNWGMSKANRTAFTRALNGLDVAPKRVLLDGCLSIDVPVDTELVVEPELDNKYICVAAASILAKVSRDTYVVDYVGSHPELETNYDLAKNKGYGTLKHRNGILKMGKDEKHRNLFLRKLLHGSNNTNATAFAFLEETNA
jgi:ribonuclease HII